MRKIRFATNVALLFLKRFGLLIIVGVLVGGGLFLLRQRIITILPGFTSERRIGVVGRFTVDTLPVAITSRTSYGLTILDEENVPQPGIAESWQAQEDGKLWRFKIREGLQWQDNSPVKSSDLIYKLPDVQVTYPDTTQIEFRMPDPYSPFPVVVSRPYFKKGLLGVGEWEVKRITSTGGFVKELAIEGRKNKERERYRFYPTEQSVITALRLGEIDEILEITDPAKLLGWEQLKVDTIVHEDRFVALFLNTQEELLSEKPIRQALAYALKKTDLGQDTQLRRAISPISPASWAYNPFVKTYDYNTTRAKDLLEELPEKQRKNLTVNLVTIPSLLQVADKIAKDWEEIGIKTTVQVGTGIPEQFQALLATQIIPPDPDQYSLWHSTQTQGNVSRYKNARVDKLLEDGRKILNQGERQRIYLDFQRFLLEDSPVIFLYHPVSYGISRK